MPQDDDRRFVFTGTGPAYFRIWIVNLLLTAVTLGLYSPWAKVRRLRYFYGNTLFDGSPFEFHGRPIALLKGRLIGLVLLGAYTQAARFSVKLWIAVVLVLICVFPWLLWKSLRFRLANSSYRGIRFGFDGSLRDAYLTFVPLMLMVVGPGLSLIVAGEGLSPGRSRALPASYGIAVALVLLLAPWFYFRLRAYQHGHARLGSTAFAFDGRARQAYWLALKLILAGVGVLMSAMLVGLAIGAALYFALGATPSQRMAYAAGGPAVAVAYLIVLSAFSLPTALVQNYVWNRTTLGGAPFISRVGPGRLWSIGFANLFLTLVTVGFFWPFAVVRTMRYRIGQLAYYGDSGAVAAAARDARLGATGEESADLFGLDLAL